MNKPPLTERSAVFFGTQYNLTNFFLRYNNGECFVKGKERKASDEREKREIYQPLGLYSVGGSGMIVYGAYLDDKEDVVHVAVRTAIFDTIAAMVASLVIIPACFAWLPCL